MGEQPRCSESRRSATRWGSPTRSRGSRPRRHWDASDDRRWLPHRAVEPRHLASRGSARRTRRKPSPAWRGRTGPSSIGQQFRRSNSRSRRSPTRWMWGFWRAVLGYAPASDDNAVDPLGHGSTVWLQELDESRSLRHAMHVDVSVAREQVEARLEAALAAGGSIVDDSSARRIATLADRAGNACASAPGPTVPARMFPLRIQPNPPSNPTRPRAGLNLLSFHRTPCAQNSVGREQPPHCR